MWVSSSKTPVPFIPRLKTGVSWGFSRMKEKTIQNIMVKLGKDIGKLHGANTAHGDLTTSNMLLYEKDANEIMKCIAENKEIRLEDIKIYFIDISLGEKDTRVEKLGEDLDVFFKAYESTHPTLLSFLKYFWKGYKTENPEHRSVKDRLAEIKKRARYR